ncbi:uncharacterized protein LOC128962741 [Oppia nitens]|uniref:uncharacterized protein LOC128962741 n=1 Tax=Oppia nitens TaxID=1686743 RepID=UPI0023D9D7AC|nr:uncharacterized protein LOC128962741 [Oppia nitens]
MKFSVAILLAVLAGCQALSVQPRADQDQNKDIGGNLNRIIGFKQFEEWLRLIQSQMTRLTDQFNRLLTPREGRLENKELAIVKQTVNDIDSSITLLNGQLARNAGALQANNDQNRDFSLSRVPFLEQIEEMLKLVQKQITDVSTTVTRALTGGLDLKGTTADEMNKAVDGSVMSQVPFLKEFEEYLELFQKQINRFGGTVQRIIQGGQRKD